MDVLTPEQRRLNMSRIRARDTRPEMMIRHGLHRAGFRYRLHVKALPGTPDLVFPARKAVILIHGCFWHGHDCPLFRIPTTREDFWRAKIAANRARDERVEADLLAGGWRVLTVWECSLKGSGRRDLNEVLDACRAFILGIESEATIRSDPLT